MANKLNNVPFNAFMTINKAVTQDDGQWIVEGFCATTDLDLQGDIITEEALEASAKDLMKNTTVLFNHDENRPIGKTLEARKETMDGTVGLWVKVAISKAEKDIWLKIKEDVINKFSIRGKVERAKRQFVESVGKVVNVIHAMKLIENSLVSLPANAEARTLRWYISKALKEHNEGGDKEMDEIIKQFFAALTEKAMSFDQYAEKFKAYCEENKVELSKSTEEELDAVFIEFLKQEPSVKAHVDDMQNLMSIAEALIGNLPEEMAADGEKLMAALRRAMASIPMSVKPYPAPQTNSAGKGEDTGKGEDETPPKPEDDSGKGSSLVRSIFDFLLEKEKEKGETLSLDDLKEQVATFMERKLSESHEDNRKSLDELSNALSSQITKSVDGVTEKIQTQLSTFKEELEGSLSKQSEDLQGLNDRLTALEGKVPGTSKGNDDVPSKETKKGSFSGVLFSKNQ